MSYEPYPSTPPPYHNPYGAPTPPPPNNDPLFLPKRGASFGEAIQRFFKKYAVFKGRASRSEYWWYALFSFLVGLGLDSLQFADSGFVLLSLLWALGTIVPSVALACRRLHDVNRSGWWLLIALIPVVGWIILLIWYCTDAKPEGVRFDS
jgi:uncharacterized membrane protein YhaH (DUF805 family)